MQDEPRRYPQRDEGMLSAFVLVEAERLETQDVVIEAQRPLDILYPPIGVISIGYLHRSRKSFRSESYQSGHRISVCQVTRSVLPTVARDSMAAWESAARPRGNRCPLTAAIGPPMPARPATARFRPARSPVPSTAGGSRGGAGDEMPWVPLPARLRPYHPEPRRPCYPHAHHSTLSDLLHRTVASFARNSCETVPGLLSRSPSSGCSETQDEGSPVPCGSTRP